MSIDSNAYPFQRGLVPDALEVIPGTINLWSWYQMLLMLVIMAVNRFVYFSFDCSEFSFLFFSYIAVCHFNKYLMIFTAQTSVIIIIVAWMISGTYTMIIQFVVPCCAMVTYYPIFTFSYRNPTNQENLVNEYNPPITQICTVILILFYIRVSMHIKI